MTSMLNLETGALPDVESREVKSRAVESRDAAGQDPAPQSLCAATEYEIVLGRAQIASWLFVGVVAVAICSSLAYLAGEKITARKAAAISRPAAPSAPVPPPPVAASAELPQASIMVAPKADLAPLVKNRKTVVPLFAEPEIGKVYLQIGAVERGMATLLAEGLRSHGFDSFVAPGPNDKIFRVLIGPLPDPATFQQAMVTVNALELANFARKYQK
jgi:cell division septation protein DedD